MLKGVLLVLCACLIWGLIFVVPGLMADFSPLEVALGRYFFLGVVSSVLMISQGLKKWRAVPWAIWRKAAIYAGVVNIFYYFSLVTGLRYSNASVIALLLGLSPITLSFYGNWRQKECSYQQLILPSLLIGGGLFCVNWEAFLLLSGQASWEYAFGLCCGILSLAAWNWYVVANANFLKTHEQISSSDWSTLIGIATFAWVLLIIPGFVALSPAEDLMKYSEGGPSLYYFLAGSFILGMFCSWLGSYLWNVGSQKLPISLAGQLTIFETIFGILFVFLLEASLPTFLEFLGIASILSGVFLSMHLFRLHAKPPLHSQILRD